MWWIMLFIETVQEMKVKLCMFARFDLMNGQNECLTYWLWPLQTAENDKLKDNRDVKTVEEKREKCVVLWRCAQHLMSHENNGNWVGYLESGKKKETMFLFSSQTNWKAHYAAAVNQSLTDRIILC